MRISDEQTLEIISENPYMQFFMGLNHYTPKPLFSASLFIEMRKKLGKSTFDEFSKLIINISNPKIDENARNTPLNKG